MLTEKEITDLCVDFADAVKEVSGELHACGYNCEHLTETSTEVYHFNCADYYLYVTLHSETVTDWDIYDSECYKQINMYGMVHIPRSDY